MSEESAKTYFLQLMDLAILKGASDIHMPSKSNASLRIGGSLVQIKEEPPNPDFVTKFIISILKKEQVAKLERQKDIDFIYSHGNIRFRGNAFFQQRGLSVSLRRINEIIHSFNDLGLPPICKQLCSKHQGLILLVGPTGCGKSTTLATMIQHINDTRATHIITVEDPVEYIFHDNLSTIEQRELHYDTLSFDSALKAAMRQDPDVLMVGEMRDLETIRAAITMAETGHLVFATLHTNSAPLAIERLIDVFPAEQHSQVRTQLSNNVEAIISQRLIPVSNGDRLLAFEVMVGTDAIKNLIRDEKTHHIPNAIQTSAQDGMISMDRCLAMLIAAEQIPLDEALPYADNQENLQHLLSSEMVQLAQSFHKRV